jgi:hypothetical protein
LGERTPLAIDIGDSGGQHCTIHTDLLLDDAHLIPSESHDRLQQGHPCWQIPTRDQEMLEGRIRLHEHQHPALERGDVTDNIQASGQTGREVEDQRRRGKPCESHAEQGDSSCEAEQPIQPPAPAHSSVLPRLETVAAACIPPRGSSLTAAAFQPRSSWMQGADAPALSEKHNAFRSISRRL